MTALDAVYQDRLLDLAATIARDGHVVPVPTATGSAHSRACGSRIKVQVALDGERIIDYGQQVDACALGSAAASVVGAAVVGLSVAEVRRAAAEMEAMLTRGGPPPGGAFADLAALEPARSFTNRHGSMQLAFRALEKAFRSVGL
ncbi:iron-sulfur cluster assembly scaffold protein [Thalassobaculum sp.]|uniref:iron-sulfur cluster assembly scaffold protein n=1 Tax=Thalassobaculum sp. TaxID=2022740 RepID=UPI0032ECEDEB